MRSKTNVQVPEKSNNPAASKKWFTVSAKANVVQVTLSCLFHLLHLLLLLSLSCSLSLLSPNLPILNVIATKEAMAEGEIDVPQ